MKKGIFLSLVLLSVIAIQAGGIQIPSMPPSPGYVPTELLSECEFDNCDEAATRVSYILPVPGANATVDQLTNYITGQTANNIAFAKQIAMLQSQWKHENGPARQVKMVPGHVYQQKAYKRVLQSLVQAVGEMTQNLQQQMANVQKMMRIEPIAE